MTSEPAYDPLVDFGKLNRALPVIFAGLAIIFILPWAIAMPGNDEGMHMLGWSLGVGASLVYPLYAAATFSVFARAYRFALGKPKETVKKPIVFRKLIRFGFYAYLAVQLVAIVLMWT